MRSNTNDLNLIKINVNSTQSNIIENETNIQKVATAPKEESLTHDDIQDLFTNNAEDRTTMNEGITNDFNLNDQTGATAIQTQIAAHANSMSINPTHNMDLAHTSSTNTAIDTHATTTTHAGLENNIDALYSQQGTATEHNANLDINNVFADPGTNIDAQNVPNYLTDPTPTSNTENSDFSMPTDNQTNLDGM